MCGVKKCILLTTQKLSKKYFKWIQLNRQQSDPQSARNLLLDFKGTIISILVKFYRGKKEKKRKGKSCKRAVCLLSGLSFSWYLGSAEPTACPPPQAVKGEKPSWGYHTGYLWFSAAGQRIVYSFLVSNPRRLYLCINRPFEPLGPSCFSS